MGFVGTGQLYLLSSKPQNLLKPFSSSLVVGMLAWGYIIDRFGRKTGMFSASIIVIVFTALSAGAYGANGSVKGMLQALIAYRCLAGVGIGAEYPAGSCSSR